MEIAIPVPQPAQVDRWGKPETRNKAEKAANKRRCNVIGSRENRREKPHLFRGDDYHSTITTLLHCGENSSFAKQ